MDYQKEEWGSVHRMGRSESLWVQCIFCCVKWSKECISNISIVIYIYFCWGVFVCMQSLPAVCGQSTWNLGLLQGAAWRVSCGETKESLHPRRVPHGLLPYGKDTMFFKGLRTVMCMAWNRLTIHRGKVWKCSTTALYSLSTQSENDVG